MFRWFKSNERKKADKVLASLTRAIKEVHPNRFVDQREAATFIRPKLSQLNLLLGREETERLAAVAFSDVVAMTSACERKGLADQLDTVVAHDPVLHALVTAAMHERHGMIMRDEIRERAEQLLRCINPVARNARLLP
jgi:hypothetical protein